MMHTVYLTTDEVREARKAIEREIARQRYNCGDVGVSEAVHHLAMASAMLCGLEANDRLLQTEVKELA